MWIYFQVTNAEGILITVMVSNERAYKLSNLMVVC